MICLNFSSFQLLIASRHLDKESVVEDTFLDILNFEFTLIVSVSDNIIRIRKA